MMEQWQRQQREARDAERKKKAEAANTLQNFRGGVKEDELKLAAIKKDEQKKKAEATAALQGFRGGVKEDELKLSALKDAERKKKAEAAAALQGFRGGVKEDELKLAAMKKAEREKQKEAANNLHSYRGNEPIESKPKHTRPEQILPDGTPVSAPQKDELNFAPGSVSALAANFNKVAAEDFSNHMDTSESAPTEENIVEVTPVDAATTDSVAPPTDGKDAQADDTENAENEEIPSVIKTVEDKHDDANTNGGSTNDEQADTLDESMTNTEADTSDMIATRNIDSEANKDLSEEPGTDSTAPAEFTKADTNTAENEETPPDATAQSEAGVESTDAVADYQNDFATLDERITRDHEEEPSYQTKVDMSSTQAIAESDDVPPPLLEESNDDNNVTSVSKDEEPQEALPETTDDIPSTDNQPDEAVLDQVNDVNADENGGEKSGNGASNAVQQDDEDNTELKDEDNNEAESMETSKPTISTTTLEIDTEQPLPASSPAPAKSPRERAADHSIPLSKDDAVKLLRRLSQGKKPKEPATTSDDSEEADNDDDGNDPFLPRRPGSQRIHFEVLFSFGLVTSSDKPSFNRYMSAVDTVMRSILNTDEELRKAVKYNPREGPRVKEYSFDDKYKDSAGRSHVKRVLCIASVPVSVKDDLAIPATRDRIVDGLQQSVKNGRFMTLAQQAKRK